MNKRNNVTFKACSSPDSSRFSWLSDLMISFRRIPSLVTAKVFNVCVCVFFVVVFVGF